MSRPNQAIYKEIRNEYRDLVNRFNEMENRYFIGGMWNPNYDFYTDYAYEANGIYEKALVLEQNINYMLHGTKFELKKTEAEYDGFADNCRKIKEELKQHFDSTLELLSQGNITEAEHRTLESLAIYR